MGINKWQSIHKRVEGHAWKTKFYLN